MCERSSTHKSDQALPSSIANMLRAYITDDHKRGCQGREYTCSCGYDDKRDSLLIKSVSEIERLRGELETANANCDRMAALSIDNAKDTLRLRAALKWIAANTYGYEPHAMSDEEAKVYFANLFFAAQGKARAALTGQPAAPEDSDPPCTCCGGTGVTYQTERRCACQPAAPGGDA